MKETAPTSKSPVPAKKKGTTGGAASKKSAPKKKVPSRLGGEDVLTEIARRIREVRAERYGELGGPTLARALNLPARTWYNYENGVQIPAEVLLDFLLLTRVEPRWLRSGDGPKYRGA